MKLSELLEVNFPGGKPEQIDVREPSGVSSPTNVDPDKIAAMDREKKDTPGRAGRLRKNWKMKKNARRTVGASNAKVQHDNEDLSGSGAWSIMNSPFDY